jgi:hypothetical protein
MFKPTDGLRKFGGLPIKVSKEKSGVQKPLKKRGETEKPYE